MSSTIIITISVITLTFCASIRVPTSWSSTPADRNPTVLRLPGNTHRFSYQQQPHVIIHTSPKEIPKPIALAHQKYIRNKDIIKKTPLQVDNKKKIPLLIQNRYSQPLNQGDWIPIVDNKINKRNNGQSFVVQQSITHPNVPRKQSVEVSQDIKPVYEFDANFNPVISSSQNSFFDDSPKNFFDEFKFLPLPKQRDPYEERKERILLNNHRDDETHEPSEDSDNEKITEEEEKEDEHAEGDKEDMKEDEKAEPQKDEEAEEEEEGDRDEGETAQISEHEAPAEVPTRPIYPGEGKWAQRGLKHRPYISNHKFTVLEDDGEKPEGHDVFDRAEEVFHRQSNRFAGNFASFPGKHKLGHFIQPTKQEEDAESIRKDTENDNEELNEDEEDEDFVPTQVYSQVRKTEDEEHLPPVYEGPAKLREVIKDSKIQTVYTEEGYEDIAYDHAGHEKEAAENEGFAEAEEEVQKEKLKKAPKKKYRLEPPGDSVIEESNYDNSKSVVGPNGIPPKEELTNSEDARKPSVRNNNFVKTKEIKTTAVKDNENGGKEMEVLSEIKIMMVPSRNGTKLHKFVKVLPKSYKLPRKSYVDQATSSERLTDSKTDPTEKNLYENIPTTLQPQNTQDIAPDGIPIPTTSTEALPFLGITKSPLDIQGGLTPTKGGNKSEKHLRRKKRSAYEFEKFEVDTDFIDKINHTIPIVVDRTHEKYPYYFMKNHEDVNKNSALRYAEDMKNIPEKVYGEMTFYEQAHNRVPCEEVETDVDPIPERVKNAEENAEEMEESHDVAELAESPRLRGLGDKIRCFKKRYFGENPLDSPFFKEDSIPAVTPPYRMSIPLNIRESVNKKQNMQLNVNNHETDREPHKDASVHPNIKSQDINESKNKVQEDNDERLSENASSISEKSSEHISIEENEVNIDDAKKSSEYDLRNLESYNRYPNRHNKIPKPEIIEDYSGLETLEDDTDSKDEDDTSHLANDGFGKKLPVRNQGDEISKKFSSEKIKAGKDHPTKFTLTIEESPDTKGLKVDEKRRNDEAGLNIFKDIISKLLSKSNTTNSEPNVELSTTNPDAEVVDVDKLPIPTEAPIISIITTPKYTIDLVPKHIYDQIELLRYLPSTENETSVVSTTTAKQELTSNTSAATTPKTIIASIDSKTLTNAGSGENFSREPKILVNEAISKMDDETTSDEAQSLSSGENLDDKPESLALRSHRRKNKRKRPFVVFDVNRFWPTTPFPFFQKPIKFSTVLPKHKVKSQVHYKDEIKPSEQFTVFTDVLNIIRNSSVQDPLMVAESHDNKVQYSKVKHPLHQVNYENSQNTFQNNYQNYPLSNVPHKLPAHKFITNGNYPQATRVKTTTKQIIKEQRPAIDTEEISTRLKNNLKEQNDEEDEIRYYTSHDIGKLRPHDTDLSGSTFIKSSISLNRDEVKSSERQENVDYIQEPMTEVIGLVPPGRKHYRTIYKTKSQEKEPTSIHSIVEGAPVNKFYFVGMKPPPKSQNIHLYSDLNKIRRGFHPHPRSKRQIKPNYTELVRSRGPQFETTKTASNTKEEDDYVPHRPKNYHYDEKTGKIVYDNPKGDESQDEEDIEYAVVYEEVTEKPVSTSTLSWIATARPNKDEKPLLFFVEKLKSHPDYKLIPDPVPKEENKEPEVSAQEISTTIAPLSTTPPPFLNILEKIRSDSSYRLILDKTTSKPSTTTALITETPLEEEIIEESQIDNSQGTSEGEQPPLSDLIFDISEFLPKTKVYEPKTSIDYSKYKTIERPQVNTRHNLSSRYNSETDKQLQEVNTKKIPIVPTTASENEETVQVSESRLDEQTPEAITSERPISSEKASNRNIRRKLSLTSTSPTSVTTQVITSLEPVTSTTIASEVTSIKVESTSLNETTTTEASSTTSKPETTSTQSTSAKIQETTTTSPPKRVRIRGRIRSSTIKTSSPTDTTTASTTISTTTVKLNYDTTHNKVRRRPARIKVRTSTEKYFAEEDVDKSSKVVRRRQQSEFAYYDNGPSTHAPWRLAPIIVDNNQNDQRAKESSAVASENGQLAYVLAPRSTLVPPEDGRPHQQNPTYLSRTVSQIPGSSVLSNPIYENTYVSSLSNGNIVSRPSYRDPVPPQGQKENTEDIPTYAYTYQTPLENQANHDRPASTKQLSAPLSVSSIPNFTYNQPITALKDNPYFSTSQQAPERNENLSYLTIPEGRLSISQEESTIPTKVTSKEPSFAPVTVGNTPQIPSPTPPTYNTVTLETLPPSAKPSRSQGRRRSRINQHPSSSIDNFGFVSSTKQPFTSVTLQEIQNVPQSEKSLSTNYGISTTGPARIQTRRRQRINAVEPNNLDALIAPLIAVHTSTEHPSHASEVDVVPSTSPLPDLFRDRPVGRQRSNVIESRTLNVPLDSLKVRDFSESISSPSPFNAVTVGSTLVPSEFSKPQLKQQRVNGLEARKLEIPSLIQNQGQETSTFGPLKQPTFGPPVVLDFFTSTTTQAPKPTRRRRPRIKLTKNSEDNQKTGTTNVENREARRIRGGNVRRQPERRRGGNIVQQQMKHRKEYDENSTEPSTTSSEQEDSEEYYLKHKHKHYHKEDQETPSRRKMDTDNAPSKNANVEVFQNYDKSQRHGGNYRALEETADVLQSGTANRRTHSDNAGRRNQNDSSRGQNVDSNVHFFNNYDTRQNHEGDLKPPNEGVELLKPLIAQEPLQKIIRTSDADVEAFKNYNENQKLGWNHRKQPREDVTIGTDSLNRRNEEIVLDSTKNQKQDSVIEVTKGYNHNQRHGGNYREQDDPDNIGGFLDNRNAKLSQESESIQSKKVNVEVFRDYDLRQKHGGNYEPEVGDSILESSTISSRNHKIIHDPKLHKSGLNQNHHSTGQIPELEKIQSDNLNIEHFTSSPRHEGNYEKQDDSAEASLRLPSPKQRRRRPISSTTVPSVEYESSTATQRNNFRRRDPLLSRRRPTPEQKHDVSPDKVQSVKLVDTKQQDTQEIHLKKADVEAYKEYDKNNKHGGNYKAIQDEESKENPVKSSDNSDPTLDVIKLLTIPLTSVISGGAKELSPKKPTVQEVSERLTTIAPKPFAFYNDPKLANNVNQLKDLTIPEAVTDDFIEDVAQEDTSEEDYEDLPVYLGNGATSTPVSIPTTTVRPVTTTTSLPKIIKDPSKRLYYYASV